MWVVAHRGGAELYPENSMQAFTELAKQGVDLVECDVHLSKDGYPVVIHDDNLRRTAGIDKAVSEMTLAELKQVDVGDGQGVPALIDVLEAIDIPVVVELKSPSTMQAMDQLLDDNPQYIERIVPLSFVHDITKHLSQCYHGLMCGALLVGFPVDPVYVAQSAGCKILSFHHEGLQSSYVDRCHVGNILATVWSPNAPNDIRRVIAAGVDGIGSDRPDLVKKIMGEVSP